MSSRQIDARNLILALAQLLNAERLEQLALAELGVDSTVGQALSAARSSYVEALPGIQEMRNALTHYDDWSQGKGRGPQKRLISAGVDRRAVARDGWAFGYDPSAHTVSLGPHSIDVETAVRAAANLARAIYAAAREVDNDRSETHSSDR